MKLCDNCKWADWKRTANGRLHPDKTGRCRYVVVIPAIPASFRWGYSSLNAPQLVGGHIKRGYESEKQCPIFAPSEP